ncbi:MAG: DUF1080 domain-containing protein [Phycisphaerae bacterium]|nr:DUF1080 domain-containing protein [Phycisphaerae bacterium]
MKYLTFVILGLAVSFGVTGCHAGKANQKPLHLLESYPEAWTYYLADPNATLQDVWQLRDSVLICKGTPLGYLYTQESYDDFILKLEWRWAPYKTPGKGGVLIRMTGAHKIWPKSLEAQINVNEAGDFWGLDGYGFSGDADRRETLTHDLYGELTHLTKTEAMENPPGQWNTYEIHAKDDTVTLFINGKQVNQATQCPAHAGRICLTSEGHEIHFRNISLTVLD